MMLFVSPGAPVKVIGEHLSRLVPIFAQELNSL